MGEKVEKKNKGGEQGAGEKKKGGGDNGGGKKEAAGPTTVVLKVDMHCEGCAHKVKKAVKGFPGVDAVSTDTANNKITVVGNVDPLVIRERLETKTRKKVDLISPVPKKDSAPKGSESNKPQPEKVKEQKKPDDKKTKPIASSTVVLKIRLHCDGCIQRIRKSILKIKGVETVNVDSQKDLVTVKGTMDVNSLAPYLRDKFRRNVDVVTEKKDGGGGGGEKKEKAGGGGDGDKKDKGKGDGGDKKKEGSDGEKKEAAVAVKGKKMEYYGPYGYGGSYDNGGGYSYAYGNAGTGNGGSYDSGGGYSYGNAAGNGNSNGSYRIEMVHAPQIFSDENPNACSIM